MTRKASRILDDDTGGLQGTDLPPAHSHCRRNEEISTGTEEGKSGDGRARIAEELGRLGRERLALLKLIENGTAPGNDTAAAASRTLKGAAEVIRALHEVEGKTKRASRDLALHAA